MPMASTSIPAHHIRFQRLEVMHGQGFGVHFGNNTPFNEVLDCRIHDVGLAGASVGERSWSVYHRQRQSVPEQRRLRQPGIRLSHLQQHRLTRRPVSQRRAREQDSRQWTDTAGTAYGVVVAWGDAETRLSTTRSSTTPVAFRCIRRARTRTCTATASITTSRSKGSSCNMRRLPG